MLKNVQESLGKAAAGWALHGDLITQFFGVSVITCMGSEGQYQLKAATKILGVPITAPKGSIAIVRLLLKKC